jgi:hypothetical protein
LESKPSKSEGLAVAKATFYDKIEEEDSGEEDNKSESEGEDA